MRNELERKSNKEYMGEDDLIMNTAPRVPVCLCLDTSTSMETCVEELMEGVQKFIDAVNEDAQARASCELAIVTFDSKAKIKQEYATIDRIEPPYLNACGNTQINLGVAKALDLLNQRKRDYKRNGVDYFQPWLVIMSDGEPTCTDEELAEAQASTKELEAEKKLVVFNVGIGDNADLNCLSGFSNKRRAVRLKDYNFNGFFEFLSKSVSIVSRSRPEEAIKLDASNFEDWATI